MSRIILDLCSGSGSWSQPYVESGYDVRRVTLPHLDVREYVPPSGVHGVLAAPPCTMFSLARTRAKTPRNLYLGMETVEACMRIIWLCRSEGSLKWWALENPIGLLRQFLGQPRLTFNPYDFGDPYPKRTDLYGYFKAPRFNRVDPLIVRDSQRGKAYSLIHMKTGGNSEKSRAIRSVTPEGFSRAFMKANP